MTKNDHAKDLLKLVPELNRIWQRLELEVHVVGSIEHKEKTAALAQIQTSLEAIREAIGILEGHRR